MLTNCYPTSNAGAGKECTPLGTQARPIKDIIAETHTQCAPWHSQNHVHNHTYNGKPEAVQQRWEDRRPAVAHMIMTAQQHADIMPTWDQLKAAATRLDGEMQARQQVAQQEQGTWPISRPLS